MKNTPFLLSAFFTTLFATSNVFAAIECPNVNDINSNAYRLDTVWNSATAKSAPFPIYRFYTSNGHDENAGKGVFASSAFQLKNRPWYLSWSAVNYSQSDKEFLQSAFETASTVTSLLGEVHSDDKDNAYAICVYLPTPNFNDNSVIPTIVAVYKQKDTPLVFNPDDFFNSSKVKDMMIGRHISR